MFVSEFSDKVLKPQSLKEKTNSWDFIKFKCFNSAKDISQRLRTQARDRDNFANGTSDKVQLTQRIPKTQQYEHKQPT